MFGKKQLWFMVALSTLVIFCFILTAHSVIPHDHAHDMTANGLLSSLHSGVSEDKLTIVFVVALFFSVRNLSQVQLLVSRMCLRFSAQGPEVHSLFPHTRAASDGLLNPRPY